MSDFIANIISSLGSTPSKIEQYKALIALQCFATPQEWRVFRASSSHNEYSDEFKKQILTIFYLIFHQKNNSQNYMRQNINNTISFYYSLSKNKKLLMAFTGRAQVLFGPIARVLQYFPSNEYDVLVLRDTSKLGYTQGLPGHSLNFDELVHKIKDSYISGQYEDVFCMGTSGGGGPALVAAVQVGAKAGVSFSGRPPTSSKIYGATVSAIKMESTLIEMNNKKNNLTAIFPSEHKDDVINATTLNSLGNVSLFPIYGFSDHNILHDLDLAGRLEEVLIKSGLLCL